jgi:hypothetical protein
MAGNSQVWVFSPLELLIWQEKNKFNPSPKECSRTVEKEKIPKNVKLS